MSDLDAAVRPLADLAQPSTDEGAEPTSLLGGQCAACSATSYPRAYICPDCNGTDIEGVELPADGVLYSWTTVHISPTFPTPYTLGYVDLSNGLRVLAQILAGSDPLACDLPVRFVRSDQSPTGWGFAVDGGERR